MRVEWPTVWLVAGCYLVWGLGITVAAVFWLPGAIALTALTIALHASIQHEIIHGHPLPSRGWSQALVFPSLNLAIPYLRFRDTHLAHHQDANLTDPYDDPETNYLDPEVWAKLPVWLRAVLSANNTLIGRLLIGPVVAQVTFMAADARAIARGDGRVAAAWGWHVLASAAILGLVWLSPMPVWAYLVAAYAGLSILKIRTFLEHQAHERARGRTVVIEDRGLLAFLFLNNNFHVVHHMHPRVPWYRLPKLYFANRDKYLTRNFGYRYGSYGEIFRRYLWRAKDPVAHPLHHPR
ncbi:fatty acid desaturase [Rhodobacterales bacterium HKCCE3408]|nr:fatty acid desaturase [Rhodobacterales bacterium HKCCE3408]